MFIVLCVLLFLEILVACVAIVVYVMGSDQKLTTLEADVKIEKTVSTHSCSAYPEIPDEILRRNNDNYDNYSRQEYYFFLYYCARHDVPQRYIVFLFPISPL